jgi:ATP-dependent 26S proteasome regulatory subunit
MKLKIEFGRTTSPVLEEAIQKAEKIPGFKRSEGPKKPKFCIVTDIPFNDQELWHNIVELLNIVGSWKSTAISYDDNQIQSHWRVIQEIQHVINCYSMKQATNRAVDYCYGKDAPTSDMTSFGCRFLKGVGLQEYGTKIRWYEFGRLSDDQKFFTVDKKAIVARIREEIKNEACLSCPAFSWDHVSEALKSLPDRIDLEKSNFSIRFSDLDPRKAIGIKKRNLLGPIANILVPGIGKQNINSEPKRNVPTIFYKDIAGQDDALQQLRDICELPLKHPEYFASLGLTPHRGVILSGPPGNGKTLMAKAVATESDAHLELINGPEILSKWVGQSEHNLRCVFERARALAPSIILIDELDAIAPQRAEMMHQHDITLISQMLVLLDGMEERGRVIVIGTTNRLEAVDPAIKRPGRFDYHIQVPLPNEMGREAILRLHLSRLRCVQRLDVAQIVASTPGWSGAELKAIITEAGLLAIKRGIRSGIAPAATLVTQSELSEAVAAVSAKREGKD